jgi:hypothetical protein
MVNVDSRKLRLVEKRWYKAASALHAEAVT